MDSKKIERVIQLLKKHELHEIEVEEDGKRIRVTSSSAQFAAHPAVSYTVADAQKPAVSSPDAVDPTVVSASAALARLPADKQVRSPFVGTFYEAPSPDKPPFVKAGQRVKKGETLCIIEAMKIMNEIEAERDCTIKEVLVNNEEPVEFDQILFVIE